MMTSATTMQRIIAVDVGEKRLGLAMSDPLGYTAQPLGVQEPATPAEAIAHVAQQAHDHAAALVLVGHPVTLRGTASAQTRRAEAFAAALTLRCACPVQLWDERLTTAQGERVLLEGGVRRQRRRTVVNQLAAQLILQQYLDTQR